MTLMIYFVVSGFALFPCGLCHYGVMLDNFLDGIYNTTASSPLGRCAVRFWGKKRVFKPWMGLGGKFVKTDGIVTTGKV
ncbi:hypothetical protein L873DRAFT_1809084 [Choiromyces venosus 120613-1]|uniref:Uncharacterized protein n=1 Tax=Choiromyces venosus 120613-1 TaxID=1336337 RepID=A0A3N4JIC8_9PEZI|nr:hypothetical protein L873DRAFT_1809084 [Choiromyces venosus 120613-1]